MNPSEIYWLDILNLVQLILILIGVVIFMITPKRQRREFLELGAMLWLAFLTEATSTIGWYTAGANMNLNYNIANLLNLPIAVLLYRHRINWNNKNSLAKLIIIAFVLFGLINLFFIQGPYRFNSYTVTLASVFFMIISVTYFFVLIQELPAESITKLPMFWINAAVLIYYSGTFVIYLSTDYLANVLKNNMIATWLVHNSLGTVYYILLSYALVLTRNEHLRETR